MDPDSRLVSSARVDTARPSTGCSLLRHLSPKLLGRSEYSDWVNAAAVGGGGLAGRPNAGSAEGHHWRRRGFSCYSGTPHNMDGIGEQKRSDVRWQAKVTAAAPSVPRFALPG